MKGLLRKPVGNGLSAIVVRCVVAECESVLHTVAYLQLSAPRGFWVAEANGRYMVMKASKQLVVKADALAGSTPLSSCKKNTVAMAEVRLPGDFYSKLLKRYHLAGGASRNVVRRFYTCEACGKLGFCDGPKGERKLLEYDIPKLVSPKLHVARHITALLRDSQQLCVCRP